MLDSSLDNVITRVDASFSNVYTKLDVLDSSLDNVITRVDASFSNVYTKLYVLDSSLANVITYVDASFLNVYTKLDVLDSSLANVITYVDASFSNVYTKLDVLDVSLGNVITYVDASFTNVYTKLDALDVSLGNVITYVDASFTNVYTKLDVLDASFLNVYTRGQVDLSFVSKDLFDASLNSIQLSNVYTKAEVDVSFVSKDLFDASLNSIQLSNVYTKAEVDVSFVSKELFDASLSGILLDGIFIQNNEYASYDILDITGKIIFTDNSTNLQRINDVSLNNVDISGSLNVAGSISASNIYTKTEIDASLSNIYTNSLDVSGNVTIGGSTLYVPSLFTIDPNGHGDNTGTLLINGNLVVQGVTTTINSSVVDISDKILVLASNASNSLQADGAGFEISGAKVNMLYNNSSNTFRSSIGMSISGNVVPVSNGVGSLGETGKIWDIAYIRELNVTNFTNSIDGAKIASGTISSTQIANGSILTVDISDHAITYEKIAANAVTNTRIANGAVTHAKLSSDCIQSHNIVDGTIMDVDISANAAISGSKIANASITSDKINQANNWTFSQLTSTSANIQDISTTNIEVSGNIVPLLDLGSNLGSSLKRWGIIYANDLSVNNINGQPYTGSSGGGYTKIEIDASFTNVYSKLDVLDNSLANLYTKSEIDLSFVSKELFDASLSSIQISNVYTKAEVDVSFVSKELFETSYNFLLSSVGTSNESGDGGYFQNNDYASYDILNITDTIIFTDNSNNEINNDVSFNNVDISGALNVAGTISAPNIYTKIEIDVSFVSKELFDASINALVISGGNSTTNYDTTLTIKNTIDLNEIHYDSNWYYKGQLINKISCIRGLGKTLALSDDGRTIVIGSNKNGLANVIPEIYVYYFIENSWVQKGTTIVGPVGSYFGKKVAISGNGEVISVSDVKGNIYLYKWKYNINNTNNTNRINNIYNTLTTNNTNTTNSYNPIVGTWLKLGATIIQEIGNGISMSLNYSGNKMVVGSYLATSLLSDQYNKYTDWQMYTTNMNNAEPGRGQCGWKICWNGSFYVAIGNYQQGPAQTLASISYNGILWENPVVIFSTNTGCSGICWNGNIFCAVFGSQIMTSTNGLIWITRTTSLGGQSICWGNNMFVVINATLAHISSDGISWISKNLPANVQTVCWGNNMFVVVGSEVATSKDGCIWTLVITPKQLGRPTLYWNSICWSGSIFCALTTTSSLYRIMISSDGINWRFSSFWYQNRSGTFISQVCWNGTVFCILGANGIYYSYDGITWTTVSSIFLPNFGNLSFYGFNYFCWNGQQFCCVGQTSSEGPMCVVLSPINFPNHNPYRIHNLTENSIWNNNYNPLTNNLICICWGNNKFVAISNNGETNNRVISSDDGINWAPASSGVENNNWISVCWGYDKFCAVASGLSGETINRIMISSDGMNWKPINTNIVDIYPWTSIVWGNDKFLVSTNSSAGRNGVMISSNGIDWLLSGISLSLTSVAWGNNRFIGVASSGTTNRVHTSVSSTFRLAGVTWTNLTTPALNNWTSVCWGNDIFIAVANSGTGNRIMRSSDGTTWTSVTSPADSAWSSVTFGNNRFVAVATTGAVKIMYSTDNNGTSWTGLTSFSSSNSYTSITFGNDKFCAVANSGLSNTRIITSSDGITWNSISSQILTSNWNSICWNGSIFCAVANSDVNNVIVKISTNGTIWTSAITGVLNNYWKSICWNGSIFCAVASSGNTNERVMISTNGLKWTNATSGVLDNSWSAICWNGTIFCALASSGATNERVMISINGLVWTNATSGVLDNNWSALCWNGTIFCAIANSGATNTLVMTSSDGLTWNNNTSNVPDNSWNSICWNGYIFCAVASSGTNRVMISTDGINWTSYNMNLPDTYWSSICWNGNFFCAVANGGIGNRVATSYDGITWTSRTSIYENNNWNSVCWNGTIFCAIASSGLSRAMTSSVNYGKEFLYKINKNWNTTTGTLTNKYSGAAFDVWGGAIIITYNGTTTNQYLFHSTGNYFALSAYNIAITQKRWTGIAVSDYSYCIVSDNATGNDCVLTFNIVNMFDSGTVGNWVNASSGVVNSTWNSICWNGSIFCAVARSGATTNQQVMISSNGRTWQNATSGVPDSSWVSVCWGNTMFCAVANNGTQRVMTSLDGLIWTGRVSNPSTSNWTSITWGNNLFCAVADSGALRVMISYDGITWTGIESSPPSNDWTSITWGNNIFCAVANNTTNSLMTSRDGIIWTNETNMNNPWNNVAWNKYKNLFIVFSNNNQQSGIKYMISSPNYGKFLYRENSYWYNQSLTANTSVSNLSSITWAEDRFCAIGTGFAITSIDNGNTWTRYSLGSGLTFTNICYVNGILLARSGNSLIRSLDKGATWSAVYTLDAMYNQPAWSDNSPMVAGNRFFITFVYFTSYYDLGVNINNHAIYSDDGINFGLCQTPITIRYTISYIVYSPKLNIYIGSQSEGTSYFSTWSYDGIVWYVSEESYRTAPQLINQTTSGMKYIAWSPTLELVLGISTGNIFFKSYNGTKWQDVPETSSQEIIYDFPQGKEVIWDGKNFISYTQYKVWSSSDGNNWILREDISKSNFLSNVITINKLASDGNGKLCGVGFNSVLNANVIIRFSDNYGYDFPGVTFKNGTVRIYDIQDINYVPSSENNFGHREIGYFETANESEKTSLSVEMSSDGTTVVAGFPSSDTSGNSVKIYTYENNTWKSLANQIKDLTLNSNYNFGTSVATSANGSIIAIATMSSNSTTNGYVKVYKAQNTYPKTYVQLGNTIQTNFGTPMTFYNSSAFNVSYQNNLLNDITFQNKCLALSANGYVLTIGNMNDNETKGSVKTYIYNTTNNSWNVIKDISGVNIGDRYGLEVHMPKYDYNTLAWSADPSSISTSVINYGYTGTITY